MSQHAPVVRQLPTQTAVETLGSRAGEGQVIEEDVVLDQQNVDELMGSEVQDSSQSKIGDVGQVYLDDASGQPQWVTVSTGLFGTKESFVPLQQASFAGGVLTVPVTKDQVKGAPRVDTDGHISPEEEAELYRYYGISGAGYDTGEGTVGTERHAERVGTDDAMTRSEERLNVGTERVEAGRARLRKYITTRNESVQVPVSREEVRVEREPITEANRDQAMSGTDLTEDEHEVTLHEERAVVNKETVPVERVRLDTDTVTDSEQVTEEVRAEQIEVDGGTQRTRQTDEDMTR